METIAERLAQALRQRRLSKRKLHLALAKQNIGGSSYPSLLRYLKNETKPSVEWLEGTAKLLGVRPAWLIAGEQPPTEEAYASLIQGTERGREPGTEAENQRTVSALEPGPSLKAGRRRRAVLRFGEKLRDARSPDSPWSNPTHEAELLTAAVLFLRGVEDAFEQAGKRRPKAPRNSVAGRLFLSNLLLRDSDSEGWYVTWSDQVLNVFAMRVRGLGERVGGFYDSHEPTG